MKGSVGFRIAVVEDVSPLVQKKNKEKLDCVLIRSSIFVADMTRNINPTMFVLDLI